MNRILVISSIFTLLTARGKRGGPTRRRAAALLARHRRRRRGVVKDRGAYAYEVGFSSLPGLPRPCRTLLSPNSGWVGRLPLPRGQTSVGEL